MRKNIYIERNSDLKMSSFRCARRYEENEASFELRELQTDLTVGIHSNGYPI